MKTFALSLFMALITLYTFGQTSYQSSLLQKDIYQNVATGQSEYVSAATHTHIVMQGYDRSLEKCEKYRHMRTAGIILASVGGGLIITGGILISIGVNQSNTYNNNMNNYYYGTGSAYNGPDGTAAMLGGAFCIVFGMGSAGAGIPLAIIGAVKTRRYCRGEYRERDKSFDMSYMQLNYTGNGLAMNF